ncbi:MvdC/MvdD family ATP grasp protein [Methylobacterium nigriterrae]|uniref:MvdC/MvdD family ATP grasp protein n=1 Tax=Methylobacterium nigriterrae TaxID=3127512 RepID=UPI0030141614
MKSESFKIYLLVPGLTDYNALILCIKRDKMILIIADKFDAHADAVQHHLSIRNSKFFRLNLDIASLMLSYVYIDENQWTISQNNEEIHLSDISCVWGRRLTVSLDLEKQSVAEEPDFRLWRSEWNRCLYGVYAYLRERFWLNPIGNASLMDNKFFQMKAARAAGFQIPEFISSNKKAELLSFARDHKYVALKFMSQEIYKMPDGSYSGLYVNKISAKELESFSDVNENPVTLQRYIEKNFEVRHTFIDGSHFSCKIDSQKSNRANVDWRRYDIPFTPHEQIIAPRCITNCIEKLMKENNLRYGAFDFIVDSDNNWWYLEVNTAGQWLWIEDLAGMPISARIAEALSAR